MVGTFPRYPVISIPPDKARNANLNNLLFHHPNPVPEKNHMAGFWPVISSFRARPACTNHGFPLPRVHQKTESPLKDKASTGTTSGTDRFPVYVIPVSGFYKTIQPIPAPVLSVVWFSSFPTRRSPATPIPFHRQHPLMPPGAPARTAALPWLITLPTSLSALAFVIFIIVPGCTHGRAASGGIPGCEMNLPVVYLCSFLFLAAAVYSGYRLAGIVTEGRGG
jgi:hypothetical protein